MLLRTLAVLALVAAPACKNAASDPPADSAEATNRTPLVPRDHALYDRFEGAQVANDCSADAQCFKGGCSSEVCSAANDLVGTCDAPAVTIPASAGCGCLSGQCQWYSTDGATLAAAPAPEQPATDPGAPTDCGGKTCAAGEQCIEYYGIAGPRGGKMYACGVPCPDGKCPEGKTCRTIADGPGPVCQ